MCGSYGTVPEDTIFLTLLELSLLVFLGDVVSTVMQRFRLPSVVGIVLLGILMSPNALGGVLNNYMGIHLFSLNDYVTLFAEFSVLLLIFASGLEHGFSSIRRSGVLAILAALFGAVVPFVGVFAVFSGTYTRDAALIVAAATGATSLAVIAGIIRMEGFQEVRGTDFLLTAASLDDVVTFLLLSAVLAIISGEPRAGGLFTSIVSSIIAWSVILAISVRVIPWIFNRVKSIYVNSLAMVTLFGLVVIMSLLNFSPVIAAFIAGVSIAESVKVTEKLRNTVDVLLSIFGSVFFIVIGLQFDVSSINLRVLVDAIILSLLASILKVLGFLPFAYLRLRDPWISLANSLGMVPRGEMGLVIGSIGYSMGILNEGQFGDIVLMSLITTLLGAVSYKLAILRIMGAQINSRNHK